MAIPDYQTTMLPLLCFAADSAEHSLREAIEALAGEFKLSDEERRELLPSGQQEVFDNRVGWARTYMKKAGLLRTTRRAFFEITERGIEALEKKPSRIDGKFLDQWRHLGKVFGLYIDEKMRVYTTDGESNNVYVANEKGEVLSKFGKTGDGPGEFQMAHSITLDKKGNIYVAEGDGMRIQVFSLKI